MRILIIGGSGFIGKNLIKYLIKRYPGYHITNLDRLTYQKNEDLLSESFTIKNYKFVQGDVRNQKILEPLIKENEVVINLATNLNLDEAGDFLTTDMVGTFNLMETIRKNSARKIIQISDYVVYGDSVIEENSAKIFTETDPLYSNNPQAASKAGADRLAYSYFLTYDLPVTILRCANIFGPYQHPSRLIPHFIIQSLEGNRLPIHGEGKHVRDWIYIDDLVTAMDVVLHEKKVIGEIYNVGASCAKSVLEITELILTVMDRSKELIDFVEEPTGHAKQRAVDVSKIKEDLGWQAEWDFNKALEETIEWYIKNHRWWERLVEKES